MCVRPGVTQYRCGGALGNTLTCPREKVVTDKWKEKKKSKVCAIENVECDHLWFSCAEDVEAHPEGGPGVPCVCPSPAGSVRDREIEVVIKS